MRLVSDTLVARCWATLGVLIVLSVGCGEAKSRALDGGEEAGACPNFNGCAAYETPYATFNLSCNTRSELLAVSLDGPCNVDKETYAVQYAVGSPSPGVCQFGLIFANGFTYGKELTFASQTPAVPPGCPACPPFIGPTGLSSNPIAVENPDTTCWEAGADAPRDAAPADAISDARRDAAVDGGCTCPAGDAGGLCVCKSFSLPLCPPSAATSASCNYSGTCMGCSEGAGFTCACSDAGAPVPDGGGPQWICIGTGEACTGGGP